MRHDPVGLQAATQGLAVAQYRLGVRYEKGEGVAADAAKERRPITALRIRTCALIAAAAALRCALPSPRLPSGLPSHWRA